MSLQKPENYDIATRYSDAQRTWDSEETARTNQSRSTGLQACFAWPEIVTFRRAGCMSAPHSWMCGGVAWHRHNGSTILKLLAKSLTKFPRIVLLVYDILVHLDARLSPLFAYL